MYVALAQPRVAGKDGGRAQSGDGPTGFFEMTARVLETFPSEPEDALNSSRPLYLTQTDPVTTLAILPSSSAARVICVRSSFRWSWTTLRQ